MHGLEEQVMPRLEGEFGQTEVPCLDGCIHQCRCVNSICAYTCITSLLHLLSYIRGIREIRTVSLTPDPC